MPDGVEAPDGVPIDTDNDQTLDAMDPDDDGDNVLTVNEDLNGNNNPQDDDTDGDEIPDFLDTDDDGDGILTMDEDINNNFDPMDDDTNENGIPNYLDTDNSNVGIFEWSQDALSLEVYPNPTQNNLFLNFEKPIVSNLNVQIYNALGQRVFEQNFENQQNRLQLNIADFSNGLYIILAKNEENKIWQASIVKH